MAHYIEVFKLTFMLWFGFLVGAIVPIGYFCHRYFKKIAIQHAEYLVLIMPFLFWQTFVFINIKLKTLSNLFEPFLIGGIVSLSYLFRIPFGKKISNISSVMVILSCVIAIAVYFCVPALEE